uniref:LOW QUALITY PROTEIN: secretogranin-1 n=1 Tax=Podarcis muralis TaxID=64176 RepID=UPI00109F82ED|nr:LOW QUALITY PROTEIN: secretogranin-1 [Podarcis muralis]
MEGSEATSSCQSGESSLLDIPCVISAESFLLNPRTERSDDILSPAGTFVSSASTEVDTDPDNAVFIAHTVGTSVAWRPRRCEKAEPSNCVDGVRSAPVEKDDHVEEMVTRCIVEVLLNGLSKANGPPINPLCKELLKKTNRQKQEEENIGKDAELELRHLSEPEELEKPPEGAVRGAEEPNEEELKRQAEGSEKWQSEEKIHRGIVNPQVISQESPYSFDEAHKEEKKDDAEKRTEEEGSYKRNHQSEEESNEKKHSEELEPELLDKKSPPPAGRVVEGDLKRSGGQRYLEENTHSLEEGNPESKEEEDAEEEEEESSEKYHHSFHREYEDSYERREPDAEKRGRRPRHYHRKPRLGNSSEYKRHHNGEKRDSPEESSEEESEFWDKRSHYPRHYYEVGHHFEEKRNSDEVHGSEEMEGKNRGRWHHSREENEGGDMRQRSRENEEKQHHYERRLHDEPQKELRRHYEERTLRGKASEEDLGKQHGYGIRDEKRRQHDKERQRLEWEELSKPQNLEKGEEEQRFYGPEERPTSVGEEEPEKSRHSEGGRHEGNKRALLMEEGYPRSHYLVEAVKRAAPPHIPYYQQLRWKGRRVEKKGGIADPFLESEEEEEEEPRSHPNERAFIPEYNDYDSPWEKQQLMDGVSRKHNSNDPRFEVKRQYNRMDELAHLLSNRKKSVEFPELYSSKEDVKRGHAVRSGKGKLSQRPLTLEEEKELENLAAMDLELQKIAEKFNSNRRG